MACGKVSRKFSTDRKRRSMLRRPSPRCRLQWRDFPLLSFQNARVCTRNLLFCRTPKKQIARFGMKVIMGADAIWSLRDAACDASTRNFHLTGPSPLVTIGNHGFAGAHK